MTDLDQERVDKGVAYAHGEIDKLAEKGRVNGDKRTASKGTHQRLGEQRCLRGCRLRHRGRSRT